MNATEKTLITTDRSITVDGRERSYTVVTGPDPASARDLVLIFHGSKQTGEVHRKFTGGSFDTLAAGGAAVVVYLDGFKGNWNDSRKESFFPARVENLDDVGFTRAVIAELEASTGIDPHRVLAVGYSNGGQMVIRLIHEIGGLLAGAAVFSATMPTPDGFIAPTPPAEVVPMPVLLIHGTRDPIVPFGGGTMSGWAKRIFTVGGTTMSMTDTADYFARRNGIAAPPTTRPLPSTPSKTTVELTDYRESGHFPVRLLAVHGGGHTIPGPKKAPFVLGKTHQRISAAEVVAEFFDITTIEELPDPGLGN